MSTLSSHILDTTNGQPAQGIEVELLSFQEHTPLGIATTDSDGRVRFDHTLEMDQSYTLRFHTQHYCQTVFGQVFFPVVELHFHCADERHYHVPLLLSPFAYSTYRGS